MVNTIIATVVVSVIAEGVEGTRPADPCCFHNPGVQGPHKVVIEVRSVVSRVSHPDADPRLTATHRVVNDVRNPVVAWPSAMGNEGKSVRVRPKYDLLREQSGAVHRIHFIRPDPHQ